MLKDKNLQELIKLAYDALAQARDIADRTGESFTFAPAYGMGGTYYPKRMTKAEAIEILKTGNPLSDEERENIARILEDDDDDYGYREDGWVSSSHHC